MPSRTGLGAGGQGFAGDSATAPASLGVGLLVLVARHALPVEALSAHSELGVGLGADRDRGLGHADLPCAHDHAGPRGHEHQHGHGRAAMAVGTLHGLAGSSHLLGILPALALPSDGAAVAYLLCVRDAGSVSGDGERSPSVRRLGRGPVGSPAVRSALRAAGPVLRAGGCRDRRLLAASR